MHIKKIIIIVLLLITIAVALAYYPLFYVESAYSDLFEEVQRKGQTDNSSTSQTDFSSLIKIDNSIQISKVPNFSINPLNSELYIVNGVRTALSGNKVIDVYYIKLYRNNLFDLNWSINYPIKVATIVNKDNTWAKQNYKEIDFEKMESSENIFFNNLATPAEIEKARLNYEEYQKQKLN